MAKKLRYLEIAQILKTRILQGEFPLGQALPSQKELSEIFNTSVMTTRGALAELEQEGIIHIIHGVGTFVAAPEVHSDTLSLQGFQNEMDRQKMPVTTTVLSVEHHISDPRLCSLFGSSDAQFSALTRLRSIDGTPVIYQKSYVEQQFSAVIEQYSEDRSLYQSFAQTTGTMVTKGKEIMTPVLLPEEAAQALGITEACTAFLSKRISISIHDKVVLYDEAYLPGPYVIMASSRQGKRNTFKYIINKEGTIDSIDSFNDTDLWEDLI
ncbi:MAG: GntR family transcriptional regulator [Spirochaetia bacterium]|nr:GntR family transcriptional regulator [Spirochaetia bacterium]